MSKPTAALRRMANIRAQIRNATDVHSDALDAIMRIVAIEMAEEYEHGVANGTMQMIARVAQTLPRDERDELRDEYRRIGAEDAMAYAAPHLSSNIRSRS